ncbi:MAG: PadR family transcriptional regulator, partial [Gemmatimonadetes bacterium]|nr:PadR family transcriptional regulator [Gemmatimonadota bacterium]
MWRFPPMTDRSLRLRPAHLQVMLLLAEGPQHGYALVGGVSARSGGKVELGPSSLYYTLGRL